MADGPRVGVLIVDDALFMRAMLREILDASGRYEVVGEAGDGREAVDKYRELAPRLVTMDIVMPEMDGIAATKEILARDPGATIVMCSSLGQESLVLQALEAGARDFIVKPFGAETVLAVLANVLQPIGA